MGLKLWGQVQQHERENEVEPHEMHSNILQNS